MKIPAPPKRNPFAVLARKRKAGTHAKAPKANRRQERVALAKSIAKNHSEVFEDVFSRVKIIPNKRNAGVVQWQNLSLPS